MFIIVLYQAHNRFGSNYNPDRSTLSLMQSYTHLLVQRLRILVHVSKVNLHRPRSRSPTGGSGMSWIQLTPTQHYRFKYDHTQRLDVCKGYMIAHAPIGRMNSNYSQYHETLWFPSHNESIYGEFPVVPPVMTVWTKMFLVDQPDLTAIHIRSYGYFLYRQPLQ